MEVLIILAVIYVLFVIIKKSNNSKRPSNNTNKSWQVESPSNSSHQITAKQNFEDNEGLASFTISFGTKETESRNTKPAEWISPGTLIKIKDTTITGGFFYFGGRLKSIDGYGTDAALIDDFLDVRSERMDYTDDSLGYWPKYSTISSKCRGAFLDWLESGRENPTAQLGYVFIYFYGLERRVLVDSQKGQVLDQEFQQIFAEIQRLQDIYGTSNSFKNYSTRLMEAMCILRPTVVTIDADTLSHRYDALLFSYLLAKTVKAEAAIPAELALMWIKSSPFFSLKTPARRCKYEFNALFKIKYTEKFGDGMVVKPNKTPLKLYYQSASSTLRGIELSQEDLPDPSGLKGPINKLIPIADACMLALDPYSRYLGRKDSSRNDLDAIMLLPDELANDMTSPVIAKFKQLAHLIVAQNDGITSVTDFWRYVDSNPPAKLNKKEAELMANIAAKAGYGIAPDINIHHAMPSLDGKVILFTVGHEKGFVPSKAFNEVGMALRLGAMVANADGSVDELEYSVLGALIDNDPKLNVTEKRSLHAYLKWRLNSPSDAVGLKARIEKLGSAEKDFVSHILVSVALADGKIDSDEIKQLEKLYTTLGLDRTRVTSDIHVQSSSNMHVEPLQTLNISKQDSSFKLNEELINLHESQTKDVQSMLHSIFASDEQDTMDPIIDEHEGIDASLDKVHKLLLEKLIEQETWPRQAVEDICQSLGLMVDGAIETINDWSYEIYDTPIFEDEGDIMVDQEIVAELK